MCVEQPQHLLFSVTAKVGKPLGRIPLWLFRDHMEQQQICLERNGQLVSAIQGRFRCRTKVASKQDFAGKVHLEGRHEQDEIRQL
jgi:hypothetical protein